MFIYIVHFVHNGDTNCFKKTYNNNKIITTETQEIKIVIKAKNKMY